MGLFSRRSSRPAPAVGPFWERPLPSPPATPAAAHFRLCGAIDSRDAVAIHLHALSTWGVDTCAGAPGVDEMGLERALKELVWKAANPLPATEYVALLHHVLDVVEPQLPGDLAAFEGLDPLDHRDLFDPLHRWHNFMLVPGIVAYEAREDLADAGAPELASVVERSLGWGAPRAFHSAQSRVALEWAATVRAGSA